MPGTVLSHARYAVRLEAPPPGGSATTRRGVLVTLRDGEGHCGVGECAPLDGWHAESIADVERALNDVARALPGEVETLTALRRALSGTAAAPLPSVVFGVEMAWLGLQARRRGTVPARVLCSDPAERVAIAALFTGNAAAAEQLSTPAAAVKVKVGTRSLDEDRAVLRALLERLPREKVVRLDGNRTLALEQALALVRDLDVERLQYFEEPLLEPADLPRLHELSGVAIALDETRRDPALRALWNAKGVAAWVLKPALHGGFLGTCQDAERGRDAGIHCVISSCFETGLGLWALAQLAACVQRPGVAAGLGTGRWLAEDLIEPPFRHHGNSVAIADWVGAP